MKYWEIIADNLYDDGWSLGWVETVDGEGRTIWIVNAHRYGKRLIVRANEKLIVFIEMDAAIRKNSIDIACRSLREWRSR